MRLIDKALKECENRYTEENLRTNYCPSFFFVDIKPYKNRKGNPEYCIYNDTAGDFQTYCDKCWDRTLIIG